MGDRGGAWESLKRPVSVVTMQIGGARCTFDGEMSPNLGHLNACTLLMQPVQPNASRGSGCVVTAVTDTCMCACRRRGRGQGVASDPSAASQQATVGSDSRFSHPGDAESPTRYPLPSPLPPQPAIAPPRANGAALSPTSPSGDAVRAEASMSALATASPTRSPVHMRNNSAFSNWSPVRSPARQPASLGAAASDGAAAVDTPVGEGNGGGSIFSPSMLEPIVRGAAEGPRALEAQRSVVAVGRPVAGSAGSGGGCGGGDESLPGSVELTSSSSRRPRSRSTTPTAAPVPDVNY